jgi:hypothetical protein
VDCIVIQCEIESSVACILQNASGYGSLGAGWPAVFKVSTKEKATSCCSCTRDAPCREGLPRYQPEGINCSRADQPTDLEAGIIATGGSNYIMRIAIFLIILLLFLSILFVEELPTLRRSRREEVSKGIDRGNCLL